MRYGDQDVLAGVDFDVVAGETVALLGPNGAGKTTTIEVLEGFRHRSAGHVAVLGVDPWHGDDRWRSRIGVVMQSWRDHPKWRVRELLAYQASLYAPFVPAGASRPWGVDDLLAALNLDGLADAQIRTLSGGQRRRLDIAVGLVGRPEIVFLDEPTASLDPRARRDFLALIQRVGDDLGSTILMTTHDLAEAEELADRILILVGGQVIATGTSKELTDQIAGHDRVRWAVDGQRHEESTGDSTAFARDLFSRYGEQVHELEVRRASLEDAYLSIVQAAEHDTPPGDIEEKAA
ncbi:ABC transporter ATP-binding protein [Desertihabitans brevis]|uniref:ABC transporter ATP-binding protein n=2 Tax=Desertihabitans brevis TaxID=2268447 RepID=A0A367YWF8_9ACTN|nr:ABC transporter ATP-binding protein [Desertihabitans brevis]